MVNEHTVFEGDVAAQLGLSRAVMKQLRESIPLEHGTHWKRGSNNRIYLKPDGIALVQAEVDSAAENRPPSDKADPTPVEEPLVADLSENKAPVEAACVAGGEVEGVERDVEAKVAETGKDDVVLPDVAQNKPFMVAKPRVVVARVVRQTRNRFILECASDEVKGVLRVRVRDNSKWRAGMRLRVRETVNLGGVWLLEGRSPRQKGQM